MNIDDKKRAPHQSLGLIQEVLSDYILMTNWGVWSEYGDYPQSLRRNSAKTIAVATATFKDSAVGSKAG